MAEVETVEYQVEYDTVKKEFTLVKLNAEGQTTDEKKTETEIVFSDGDTLGFSEDGHLVLTTEEEAE